MSGRADELPIVIVLLGLFSGLGLVAAALAFRFLFPTIDPYRNVRVPKTLAPRFFFDRVKRQVVAKAFLQ